MNKVLVSVVCTNYNKGVWIKDALESFLRQKADFEYEVLVIDDGSNDESPAIIRDFAKRYPGRIRALYNEENLGITKTWIKVCKEAKGKYIARCDGDDYWIDNDKLQKQVELLEMSKDSLWCSTDYDIVTPDGETIHRSAFENGLVDRSKSYAEMLVTKGFTMSSTWLVEADLMRDINREIDSSAVDDTFNIQLELFNRTRLTYIPEATVVYRINEGSDSRPVDMKTITSRNERLLKTQLEYIDKYKDVDYSDMLKILLRRDLKNELLAIERLQIVHQQRDHIKQLEAQIRHLESDIHNITQSRSFQLAKAFRVLPRLPRKVARKLMWLEGRRRYDAYYRKHYILSEASKGQEVKQAENLSYRPLMSIIVPTYNTDLKYFDEMLGSVKNQTYSNWQLVLVDDASPDENVRNRIREASEDDGRITYRFLETNRHIAGATNEGLSLANGEFVSLLDHDDILHPSALFEVVKLLNSHKEADFIYTDEDKINENGRHVEPFLKPDWNQELLYSVNYITHFTTIRKTVIDKIGGERGEYNGAQDWDLFLRATHATDSGKIHHIPRVLYSWRVHDASTAKDLETKPYVFAAQRKLLEDNLQARGLSSDQFTINRNRFMNGAWDVVYDGQPTERLHKSGDQVEYDKIKGIAMSKTELLRNIGRVSHTMNIYTYCQYEKSNPKDHAK